MEHRSKWWTRMIEQHGSEEAVREFMRQAAAKSRRNKKGTGGFAYLKKHDPTRLKSISARGGKHAKSD